MKLALEIPIAHLEDFSKVTEVDFALCHLVLESPIYADFYKQQAKIGRRVILDNGMHENGKPHTPAEIIEAAKRIEPSCVIPPDRLGDAAYTYEMFNLMRKDPQMRWDPALVIQGKVYGERVDMFMRGMAHTNTVMLPFREKRDVWFMELVESTPRYVKLPTHLHLLGVNRAGELGWFSRFCEGVGWPTKNVTVDTGKPIKWALKGKDLWDLPELRGGGTLAPDSTLDVAQQLRAFRNIAWLRAQM